MRVRVAEINGTSALDQTLSAWLSTFETPTIEKLLKQLPPEARTEAEFCRKHLGRSSVQWQGIPWRWTVRIEHPEHYVVLVPDPEQVRVAIPLSSGFFAENPPETLRKDIRDLLVRAVVVGDLVWTEWSLGSVGASAKVLSFVKLLAD